MEEQALMYQFNDIELHLVAVVGMDGPIELEPKALLILRFLSNRATAPSPKRN